VLALSNSPVYGGQAQLEGVMFGGKEHTITAIRRNDDSIDYYHFKKVQKPILQKLKKIPFVRGVVALIESAGLGSRHMQFSGDRYDVTPGEEAEHVEESGSKLQMILGVAVVGILSFLFGKFAFTLIPVFIADFFSKWIDGKVGQVLLESGIKLLLLLTYLYFISLTPIIKRVFQYHGAEHKVINCYEAGMEINVKNVQAQSRLHYRCGSSFMLFTVFVGMFLYFFVPTDPLWLRLVDRILLIPVVLGVSFEVLQATNACRNIPVLRYLGYPGLWLQLLTTREPLDEQVEVAIASFNMLRQVEQQPEIAATLNHD